MTQKPTYDELTRRLRELEAEVSEMRRVEEALKHQKAYLELLIDSAPEAILLADSRHRITKINPQFVEMFGFSQEEALGKRADDLIVRGEKLGEANRITEEVGQGRMVRFETVRYRKDGSPVHVELMAAPVVSGGRQIANYASYRDITETKTLQAHLAHAQKMEAIGTLAGGIAHDFNNLLMGIQGRTSLMLLDADANHPHHEHLKGIEEYVKSAAELTKQLLGFARGGKYEVKATDLNELLRKSAEMFGRTRKEITIHAKFERNLWPADVDRGQMGQVFLNLFVNAWQSMPAGGDLFLETRNLHLEAKDTRAHGLQEGRYVRVSVTDTGVGMDEKTRERIFEPFFTTKEMRRGTGLGLASAYGIIRNHAGRIGVISQPGAGTTFHVDLPASSQAVALEKAEPQEMPRGTETVLLVDDEDMVLEVGEGMLRALGYKVLLASGGKEALARYREKTGEVGLVILDMIMPHMGGGETYEALEKIHPGVKVLLSSGYSIDGQAQEILDRGCKGFIQKPFDLHTLSRKLREILER